MADEDLPGDAQTPEPGDEPRGGGGGGGEGPQKAPRPAPRPAGAGGAGYFTIYKKGQGYWTRMGTVIGAGFLGAMIAFELYSQIPTFLHGDAKHDQRIALIVALVFFAAYAAVAFWYTNKPTTVDFLIATDSEMKKVNWTTRKELIGSTRIVILFMIIITLFLFACDLLFGAFFHLVGVLKTWF